MPKPRIKKQLSFSEYHVPEVCSYFLTIILRCTRGLKSLAILPKKFRTAKERLIFYVKA